MPHASYLRTWITACTFVCGCTASISGSADLSSNGNHAVGREKDAGAAENSAGGGESGGSGRGGSGGMTASAGGGGGNTRPSSSMRTDAGRPQTDSGDGEPADSGSAQAGSGGTSGGSGGSAGKAPNIPIPTTTPSYNPCPPAGTACKIMPLGDSITEGAGSTHDQGYRLELFRITVANDQSILFVGPRDTGGVTEVDGAPYSSKHAGRGGAQIDSIVELGMEALDKGFAPDIILLMAGTNDVWTETNVDTAPNRIAAFVDQVNTKYPHVLVVVSTIIWQETWKDEMVEDFNNRLAALIMERMQAGKHVHMVDMYAVMPAKPNKRLTHYYDGVHPNDLGYKLMAETWYQTIGGLFR